jgi:hypothetical protein
MRYIDKMKRITQTRHKACGAAVVEFALLLILLLIVVAGIIEFGRTFWYYDALTKATRDGARFMSSVSVDQIGSSANELTLPPLTPSGKCSTDPDSTYNYTAKNIVYCAAVAANVPGIDEGNVDGLVDVLCDGGACLDETIPQYIEVSINAYPVTIGSWIPFVGLVGAPWNATLSPSTIMRYMCDEPGSC